MSRKVSQSAREMGSKRPRDLGVEIRSAGTAKILKPEERRQARLLQAGPAPQSVDGMEHAAPACARRQVREGFEDAAQPLEKGAGVVVGAAGLHRPVNQKRTAHDGFAIDKTPVATVRTLVAI